MNKIQELDFQLKTKFPNLATKLNKPTIAPDNTIVWFLDIEDTTSKEVSIIVEWCESKDNFNVIGTKEILGFGWSDVVNSKTYSTVEETVNGTIVMLVNQQRTKD